MTTRALDGVPSARIDELRPRDGVRRALRRAARAGCCIGVITLLPSVLPADDIGSCDAANGVSVICGLRHPEDLEVLPGAQHIIVSEYGSVDGTKPGHLSALRVGDHTVRTLYPAARTAEPAPADWGDAACPGPPGPAFSPHGIHHSTQAGVERLLVVNHGGREAVELFEIGTDEAGAPVRLTWRGCVVAPDALWLNDVAGLPGGGFLASHMMARGTGIEHIRQVERDKAATGAVYEWQRDTGWRPLAGTEGALVNGIEIADDGGVVYVNHYLGDAVVAVDRQTGERVWTAAVPAPDNSSIAPDGRLLVASHRDDLDAVLHCSENETAFCALPYAIVAVDTATGATTTLTDGGGAPFGGATVAVQIGDRLYLGAFAGERIAVRKLKP